MNKDDKRSRSFNERMRALNKRITNPLLRTFASASHGPFAIIRHVGRRSGKPYETTIMVWPLGEGFVIALTYGDSVDWYRNILAAGRCTLRWHGREYTLGKPEPIDVSTALPAFPPFIKMILRIRGTLQFVQVSNCFN
jgi:deazaflavin-dependent oxidoreductase (nitroreductase family)